MLFIVLGVLGILLKMAELGPFATLSWLWVLSPFPLALLWWFWSDKSGRTERLAMERLNARQAARRQKALDATGQGNRKR